MTARTGSSGGAGGLGAIIGGALFAISGIAIVATIGIPILDILIGLIFGFQLKELFIIPMMLMEWFSSTPGSYDDASLYASISIWLTFILISSMGMALVVCGVLETIFGSLLRRGGSPNVPIIASLVTLAAVGETFFIAIPSSLLIGFIGTLYLFVAPLIGSLELANVLPSLPMRIIPDNYIYGGLFLGPGILIVSLIIGIFSVVGVILMIVSSFRAMRARNT